MYLNKVIAMKTFEYVYDIGEWVAPTKCIKPINYDPDKTYIIGQVNWCNNKPTIILVDKFVSEFHWENNKCIIDKTYNKNTVDVEYITDENQIGYKVIGNQKHKFQSNFILIEYTSNQPQITTPTTPPDWIEKTKELEEKRKEIELEEKLLEQKRQKYEDELMSLFL
jgi:hypothetical protein